MSGCVPNLNIDNACEYHPIYLRQFKTGFHQWRANRTDTCMYREDVGLGSDSPKKIFLCSTVIGRYAAPLAAKGAVFRDGLQATGD